MSIIEVNNNLYIEVSVDNKYLTLTSKVNNKFDNLKTVNLMKVPVNQISNLIEIIKDQYESSIK